MKSICLFATAAFVAVCSFAQQQRPVFPDDFVPSPCAAENSCATFADSAFVSAGKQFFAFDMDADWVQAHSTEMQAAFAPLCRKQATCLATPNNPEMYCNDLISAEARPLCDSLYPKAKSARDNEQCKEYLEVYWMGVDQHALPAWRTAQACAAKQPPVVHTKPLIYWMSPETLPLNYEGYVQFHALDPDTHVPIYATLEFENQTIYAEANPAGSAATYYPFKIPFKYARVKNAQGHESAVPPFVTMRAPGYPTVQFRLAAATPTTHIEMTPGVESLHPGTNNVTVTAKEVESGKPIDGRLMLGNDETGYANQPITLQLPKGKRPEIWFRPFRNRYSDVVIAPAQ